MGQKILFKQVFFLLFFAYIRTLSLGLALLLLALRWKHKTLHDNILLLLPPPPRFSFFRFYLHLSEDLFQFLHGKYDRPISCSAKSRSALNQMKAGSSLLLTAHFHNWEMMGAWLGLQGVPLLSAARTLNSNWAQGILNRLRRRIRSSTSAEHVVSAALQHTRDRGCFAVLWDQYSPEARFTVPFLGQAAAMNPLPGFVQSRNSLPVYFAVLLPGGEFRIWQVAKRGFLSPERLAKRYHRFLEKLVRSHPTYWYGFCHRRFKNIYSYSSSSNVSRETAPWRLKVSRETNH
jgi:hypothetical protein